MSFRCLILPLTVATIITMARCEALAQGTPQTQLPAPTDQANDPAFPPVSNPPAANLGAAPINPLMSNGTPSVAADCMKEFAPLRQEAARRGKLIKDASDRHAGPVEACKLIGSYAQAEIKMIEYVEAHATTCAIPTRIADQLKSGNRNTEALQTKVCNVAQQMQKGLPGLPANPVGDFPYEKNGQLTF